MPCAKKGNKELLAEESDWATFTEEGNCTPLFPPLLGACTSIRMTLLPLSNGKLSTLHLCLDALTQSLPTSLCQG